MDTIGNFAIEKAVSQLCEKHDWNIEWKNSQKSRFFSPKEDENRQHENEDWNDTSFKVCLLNEYQGVEFIFYGLALTGETFTWKDVGISYEIDIHESNFHSVAHLVAMTPVMLQALKKSLDHWAGAIFREINTIIDDRDHGKSIQEQKQELYAEQQKIAARDPELAPYYHNDNRLEIREFLLTYLGRVVI